MKTGRRRKKEIAPEAPEPAPEPQPEAVIPPATVKAKRAPARLPPALNKPWLLVLIAVVVLIPGGISLGQDGGGSLLDRKLVFAGLFLDAKYPDVHGILEPEISSLAREKGADSSEAGTHRQLLFDMAGRHEKAGETDAALERYEALRKYPKDSDPNRYTQAALRTGEIYLARAEPNLHVVDFDLLGDTLIVLARNADTHEVTVEALELRGSEVLKEEARLVPGPGQQGPDR